MGSNSRGLPWFKVGYIHGWSKMWVVFCAVMRRAMLTCVLDKVRAGRASQAQLGISWAPAAAAAPQSSMSLHSSSSSPGSWMRIFLKDACRCRRAESTKGQRSVATQEMWS